MADDKLGRFYPSLIEHSLDLTAMLDEAGTILFQSPSALRTLGYSAHELVGRNAFDLIHPDDRLRAREAFDLAWRVPGPSPFVEYRFLHKNETWRVLESVGSVVTASDGERVAIVNSRDLTEQRALKDQVHHAQQVASVGRMAASLVHEFQNSLQVMLLHLDFVLETNATPALVPELDGIKRAGELAKDLARQLLDLSRTSSAAPQRLDVNAAIASMQRVLQRLAGRNVRLDTRLRATNATVLARYGLLDQVLVNLIGNARDAIRETGSIRVATRNVDQMLVIEVSDDGVGIPLRLQTRIFDPFFTTKSVTNGTGLGLSTVREMLEEAGGRIDVSSAVGCGATFTISLPLAGSRTGNGETSPAGGGRS